VRHCRRVGVRYESLLAAAAAAVAAAAAAAAVATAAIHLATVISCSTESTGTFPSSFLFGGHGNLFFSWLLTRHPEIMIFEGLKPHLDVPDRSWKMGSCFFRGLSSLEALPAIADSKVIRTFPSCTIDEIKDSTSILENIGHQLDVSSF
jgi:hypothetical protein